MKTTKLFFLLTGLAIAGLVLNGCPAPSGGETSPVPYTAGSYNNGTIYIPCYWTGTTRADLPGDGTHEAFANSIFVSGGTVYTAGGYDDGTHYAEATSIFVQ